MVYALYFAIFLIISFLIYGFYPDKKINFENNENIIKINEDFSDENFENYIKDLALKHNEGIRSRCSSNTLISTRKYWAKLRRFYIYLRNTSEKLIDLVPAAQWIIDNYYVVNRETRVLNENFNRRFFKKMPCLINEEEKNIPRVYQLAKEIIKISHLHLEEDNIIKVLNVYQKISPLTIAELWALPNVIKICLIESIYSISHNIVQSVRVKDKIDDILDEIIDSSSDFDEIIRKILARFDKSYLKNMSFLSHLLYRLKEVEGDNTIYTSFLNKKDFEDLNLEKSIRDEVQRQTLLQINISSTITSLIQVAAIDWERLFEEISVADAILKKDPSGIYLKMDFGSRAAYHKEIEMFAKKLGVSEVEVAKKSIELSNSHFDKESKEILSHVGYYIIGKGKVLLEKSFLTGKNINIKIRSWINSILGLLYFLGIILLTIFIIAYYIVYTLKIKPQIGWIILGITGFFTGILAITVSIEIMNFIVSKMRKPTKILSMDFESEIPQEFRTMVVMPVILGSTAQVEGYLEKLEIYYLANRHRNLCFSILGDFKDARTKDTDKDKEIINVAKYGIDKLNKKYHTDNFYIFNRYRKWNDKENCWMGWERKRGKLEEFNRLLLGDINTSYDIIIGNKEKLGKFKYIITIDADTELTKDSAAKLVGIMAHPLNKPILNEKKTRVIDGYALVQPRIGVRINAAITSVFSRIFAGQAGIEPYTNAVSDVYQDTFSEGIFTGKGIYDIEVFNKVLDGIIPENSVLSHDLLEGSYVRCALATEVELMDGYPSSVASFFSREHRWIRGDWQLLPWLFGWDSLGFLSRWKILDNIRRSIVPISQLVITLLGFTVLNWSIYAWIFLVLAGMIFSLAVNISSSTLYWLKKCRTNTYLYNFINSIFTIIKQGILWFILVPYRAYNSLDAIVRTLYRLTFSHKKMLQWQTAEAAEDLKPNRLSSYLLKMWIGPIFGIVVFAWAAKGIMIYAFLTGLLWLCSPIIAFVISLPYKEKDYKFSEAQNKELRLIARKTWRYFEEFYSRDDNWLTPDNYQVQPVNVLARRTSPTNVGLQLLATLSARDLGYIGLVSFLERIENVFSTLNKMEKWNGHLYNWYDTKKLEVLNPRYVSTVDSGNFIGYLIVLKNALEELKNNKILSKVQIEGLMDTVKLANIDTIIDETVGAAKIKENLNHLKGEISREAFPWIDKKWGKLLDNLCAEYIMDIDFFEMENVDEDVSNLNQLALSGNQAAIEFIKRIDNLIGTIDIWVKNTDFRPLFDNRRNLFRVGYNVSMNMGDNSYYDLLASEARLASFIAIAKGDITQKHWSRLGRPLSIIHGTATLLSWSGTMFEYLLPQIIMKDYPGTIISTSIEAVVKRQIKYGTVRGIPWGISESGYYLFDQNLNYQYRAFGVPGLGLRSDLRKSLVIAPYASIMAISIAPKQVYKNIKFLREIEADGSYGFYEALDFLSPAVKNNKRFKLIQSYMIHHQGMSLTALNNLFNSNILQKRFHNEPIIRSAELILEECHSNGVMVENDDQQFLSNSSKQMTKKRDDVREIRTTKPKYPVAGILSSNNYTIMITSNGNGFSSINNIAINRWRQEIIDKSFGMFFFIKNKNTNNYWSNTFMPVSVEPDYYNVIFSPDRVEFTRVDENIETKTEITVSPQDNVEIRRITITNKNRDKVNIELTSYFEPVLDSYESDLAHPAFSKLFVSTEFYKENGILLATRRQRKEDDKKIFVFSTMIMKNRMIDDIEYETDRSKFIGRGNTIKSPEVLDANKPLSGTTGYVLDPVMSLRTRILLGQGRSATISFIVGVSKSREDAIALGNKYKNNHVVEDTFKMALFDSNVEMQYLGLNLHQVNAIQDLVGSIFYPSRLLRGPVDMIEENRLNQTNLWKFGVSGDHPVMLFRIHDTDAIYALKDVVLAYEYLRKNGIRLDFVILNEESDGYFQPLNHKINEVISNRKIYYPNAKNPGIYILKANQMLKEEIQLLLSVARIVLSEKNHLFSRRIRKLLLDESIECNKGNKVNSKKEYKLIPIKSEELIFFNKFGGFTSDGKEYVIDTKENMITPVPWTNVISNEKFGFFITSSGSGYTWHLNSRENKITEWSNDPIADPLSEVVYIRDEYTGEFFCPTPAPIKSKENYRVRHGFGYSTFEHNSHGLKQKMTVFASGRDAVKIYKIQLENYTNDNRSLSLIFYVEWVLGVAKDQTSPFIVSEIDETNNVLMARNSYNSEFGGQIAFVTCSEKVSSYTGDKIEFIGRKGHIGDPDGLYCEEFSNKSGAALSPCGAIKTNINIPSRGTKEINFILGQAGDYQTIRLLAETYQRPGVVKVVLRKAKDEWKKLLEQIQIDTPDKSMNILLNGWITYQVLSCRIQSRSAFYQSGGAYGFRDQLQDVMALLHSYPKMVKEQILKCCSRQFLEGDVQHWWHDDSGKGVRTRISDDLLWLPFVTAAYIEYTGDTGILDTKVTFIEDNELEEFESEKYTIPRQSLEKESVFEHCIRAIERGMQLGEHGLPLIGAGDWNDGMNRVGWKRKGESVWLAWFLYKVLNNFIPVCEIKNEKRLVNKYKKAGEVLLDNIEKYCWDGEWYIRAFFDDGSKMGSSQNTECMIDSISQTWSVISKGGEKDRAKMAMNSLEKHLMDKKNKIAILLTPPFDESEPDPGYIRGYLPGVRENGGQYTHAAVWDIVAFAMLGDGNKAHETFHMLNPINHSLDLQNAMKYKQEPYVMTADVYSVYPHEGRGGWSWYTGSAGWMYQAGIYWILGIQKRGNYLVINPIIPDKWNGYKIRYRFGETLYNIEIQNPENICSGKVSITLDDKKLNEESIELKDDDIEHNVVVVLSKS